MSTDLSTSSSIAIAAPAEKVWTALTTSHLIERWFFGVQTESDWKVGSTIVHRGTYQGKPYEDKGEILRFDPPELLVHTHWSNVSGTPDSREHYQEVSWALVPRDGGTELTVTEQNLPSEQSKAVSDESWTMVLANLKQVVEDGDGSAA
jgi:uncharacterized protein YndB with AHSA1/START domain